MSVSKEKMNPTAGEEMNPAMGEKKKPTTGQQMLVTLKLVGWIGVIGGLLWILDRIRVQ